MKNILRAMRASAILFLFSAMPLLVAQRAHTLITQAVDESARIPLAGNVHPMARATNDAGAVPDADPTGTLVLLLGRSAAAQRDLDQYVSDQQNPSSPEYHHWLTPAQYADRFGASVADVAQVTSWLGSHGFSVDEVSRGGNFIRFSGEMGQIHEAFGTEIHRYKVNSTVHLANATNPQIPAALAPVVRGIATLNDFRPTSQAVRTQSRAVLDTKTHRVQPAYTINGPSQWGPTNYDTYFLPVAGDAAIIYDTPNATMNPSYKGTTYDGTGVTIGIAADSNLTAASLQDVTNYRVSFLGETAAQASQFLPTVVVDGSDPGMNSDALEAILDLEMAQALAPGAKTTMYTAANSQLQYGLFLAMQRAVDDNAVSILNVSFQECELSLGAAGNAFLNELYEQAAAQGISVVVAAGDSGSAACDGGTMSMASTGTAAGLGVNGLASTPWNVAVGGTDFDVMFGDPSKYVTVPSKTSSDAGSAPYYATAKGYIPEEPWNDSTTSFDTYANNVAYHFGNGPTNTYAGGGGKSSSAVCQGTIDSTGACSSTLVGYPKPSFQSAATPADGVRDVPDVSFFAGAFMGNEGYSQDFNNAWAICADSVVNDISTKYSPDCVNGGVASGTVTPVGGTSAATPVMAGVLAMVSQSLGGVRLGQVNPVLYNLSTSRPTVFHDITTGNNSVLCTSGSKDCGSNLFMNGYNAGPGYDLASGLGSIDVAQLVSNWNNVALSSTATTLVAGTSSTGLSSSSLSIKHGTTVYFKAAVTPASATGNVAITGTSTQSNSDSVAIATLSSGSAAFSTADLPGGSYTLNANYGGDSNHAESTSAGIPVTVTAESSIVNVNVLAIDPTSSAVTSNATSVAYGQTLYVELTPYGSSTGLGKGNPATGSATLTIDGASAGSATLTSQGVGEVVLPTSTLTPGTHAVASQYSGDASYAAGKGTMTLIVTKAPTTLSFYQGCARYSDGHEYCYPETGVMTNSVGVPPTGTASFTLNGQPLFSEALSGVAASGKQTASSGAGGDQKFDLSAYTGTTVTFGISYPGDGNYQAVSENATYSIPEPANAALLLSSSGQITATVGGSGTSTITITPSNGFMGPVALSCSVTGGTTGSPTCSIASSVTIAGSTAQTAVLTVGTTARSAAQSKRGSARSGTKIGFGCLLCLGTILLRKERRKVLMLFVLCVLCLGIPVTGCSSSSVGSGSGGSTGTPAGTYTVTVNGSNGKITGSTAVTLTVQ